MARTYFIRATLHRNGNKIGDLWKVIEPRFWISATTVVKEFVKEKEDQYNAMVLVEDFRRVE